MDKIIAFFKAKATKITAWVILALDVVALCLGTATIDEITQGVELTGVIIAAVAALVAFITERVKK